MLPLLKGYGLGPDLFVWLLVDWFVCQQDYTQTTEHISIKEPVQFWLGSGPRDADIFIER